MRMCVVRSLLLMVMLRVCVWAQSDGDEKTIFFDSDLTFELYFFSDS